LGNLFTVGGFEMPVPVSGLSLPVFVFHFDLPFRFSASQSFQYLMCETLWYSGLRRPNSESVRERLPLAGHGGFGLLETRVQPGLLIIVEKGAGGGMNVSHTRRVTTSNHLQLASYHAILAQETWPDCLAGMHWHSSGAAILMPEAMMAASHSAKFKAVISKNPDELFAS
jgi:hypothetical protein